MHIEEHQLGGGIGARQARAQNVEVGTEEGGVVIGRPDKGVIVDIVESVNIYMLVGCGTMGGSFVAGKDMHTSRFRSRS